jgi:hypothetical protein
MRYSTLERAFQLAQDGPAENLDEIRITLKSEGYSDAMAHTAFPTVRKQLRDAIQERLGKNAASRNRNGGRIHGVLRLSC